MISFQDFNTSPPTLGLGWPSSRALPAARPKETANHIFIHSWPKLFSTAPPSTCPEQWSDLRPCECQFITRLHRLAWSRHSLLATISFCDGPTAPHEKGIAKSGTLTSGGGALSLDAARKGRGGSERRRGGDARGHEKSAQHGVPMSFFEGCWHTFFSGETRHRGLVGLVFFLGRPKKPVSPA